MSNKNNNNFNFSKIERALIYTEYLYTRTKSIIDDEKPNKLFLHASLITKEYQTLGTSTRKKVTPIHSELLEVPISKTPSFAKRIPIGTIGIELSKTEFEGVLKEAQRNPISLFIYETSK